MSDSSQKLQELDAKHNELLDKLEILDQNIQQVLKEWGQLQSPVSGNA